MGSLNSLQRCYPPGFLICSTELDTLMTISVLGSKGFASPTFVMHAKTSSLLTFGKE